MDKLLDICLGNDFFFLLDLITKAKRNKLGLSAKPSAAKETINKMKKATKGMRKVFTNHI